MVVEAHDLVAREMESKWGVDRLERLVDETLRASGEWIGWSAWLMRHWAKSS